MSIICQHSVINCEEINHIFLPAISPQNLREEENQIKKKKYPLVLGLKVLQQSQGESGVSNQHSTVSKLITGASPASFLQSLALKGCH